MGIGAITPKDKRLLAQRVGRHLVSVYGKRKSYPPQVVKASMRRCDFPDVWDCWALSLFSSPNDFNVFHDAIGEACDYASMHSDMRGVIDIPATADFFSFDWLDGVSLFDAGSDVLSSH